MKNFQDRLIGLREKELEEILDVVNDSKLRNNDDSHLSNIIYEQNSNNDKNESLNNKNNFETQFLIIKIKFI